MQYSSVNYKVCLINEAPHNEDIGLCERGGVAPPLTLNLISKFPKWKYEKIKKL
jgi:hypothetical protein